MNFRSWDCPVPRTYGGMRKMSDDMGLSLQFAESIPVSPFLLNQLFAFGPFHALHTSVIAAVFKHPPHAKNGHVKMTRGCL